MAAYAQFTVGALALIATIVNVVFTVSYTGRLRDELSGAKEATTAEVDAFIGLTSVLSYAIAIFSLLFAAAVAILGVFNLKGKNGSRVTTWVLAGLGLLCGVCGSISGVAGSLAGGGTTGGSSGDPGLDEINEAAIRVADSMPGWYNAVILTVAVLNVLLYLAIVIMLAVPASNDFFRKPKADVDVMLPPEAYMDDPKGPGLGTTPPAPPAPGGPPAAPEAQPPQQPRPDDPDAPKP